MLASEASGPAGGLRQKLRDFEPRPVKRIDATTVLTAYLFLLLAVPSDRGIGPLGAAGSPSTLFALAMLLWWVWHHVRGIRVEQAPRLQIIRIALFVFIGMVLASYVNSSQLALPFIDSNGALMNLIKIAGFAGVVLVANDGLRDRERFLLLLKRVAWLGGGYALLGLVQFFTGLDFVDQIDIPGLSGAGTGGVDSRAGFIRPEATARHTLEYASVLSATLPVALTLAIYGAGQKMVARWLPSALIGGAAILSVTRSALIGIAVAMLVLVPTWSPRVRKMALIAGLAGLGVLYVAVPGLAGTIMGMFSGPDSSIDSRTSSYPSIAGYLMVAPWLGRGLGTMTADYRIFDNQYIGLLIELGVLGVLAFIALVLISAACTIFRPWGTDRKIAALGPAIGAGILAAALLSAFFDSFHFPQAMGMLSLMLGLAGAHWNISQELAAAPLMAAAGPGEPPRLTKRRIRRLLFVVLRWWFAVLLILAAFIPAGLNVRAATGVYYTKFDVVFQAPPGATKDNALRTEASSTVHYAALVQRIYQDKHREADIRPVRAPLYGTGLHDAEAVYLPDAGGQWQTNFNKSQLSVEIVKSTPEAAQQRAAEISKEIAALATEPQQAAGIWKSSQITTERVAQTIPVGYVDVRTKYALAVLLALALGTAFAGAMSLHKFVSWRRSPA
ncbi:O-antigen ligase family protein [Glutamicibacter sp. 2E12]|uniref:O-antigen ligase family protein n=1 Tax=Glutamicibacter sp. 2E12 TaxID=3416181 RepID=UPI003CEB20B0